MRRRSFEHGEKHGVLPACAYSLPICPVIILPVFFHLDTLGWSLLIYPHIQNVFLVCFCIVECTQCDEPWGSSFVLPIMEMAYSHACFVRHLRSLWCVSVHTQPFGFLVANGWNRTCPLCDVSQCVDMMVFIFYISTPTTSLMVIGSLLQIPQPKLAYSFKHHHKPL